MCLSYCFHCPIGDAARLHGARHAAVQRKAVVWGVFALARKILPAHGVRLAQLHQHHVAVVSFGNQPLIVKLSPNAENITEMALACEAAGADGLSLVNTFQAMAIDLEKRRPVFNNVFAGLSGPAIRPIALRMVYQVCRAVQVPVVGLGGIATAGDALEFIMAGAAAVQVGTANFSDPRACEKITDGIAAWMQGHGVRSLAEIRGCAQV